MAASPRPKEHHPPQPASPTPSRKSVACRNCGEPLYYPATLNRQNTLLCCARCGVQTAIPSLGLRVLQFASVAFLLAAAIMVIGWLIRNQ